MDIFLRHDRSATISFVEGASEFLAYAKRNDIYLHMKRVSCSLLVFFGLLDSTLTPSARLPLER